MMRFKRFILMLTFEDSILILASCADFPGALLGASVCRAVCHWRTA